MKEHDFNQIYQKDDDERIEEPTEVLESREKKEKKEHYDVFEKIFPSRKSNFESD